MKRSTGRGCGSCRCCSSARTISTASAPRSTVPRRLPDIHKRTCGYDVPSVQVDGMDVIAMYQAVKWGADWVREQSRPYLIEALTYRFPRPLHVGSCQVPESCRACRVERAGSVANFGKRLLKQGIARPGSHEGDAVRRAVATVQEAVKFAEDSPWPEDSEVLRGYLRVTVVGEDASLSTPSPFMAEGSGETAQQVFATSSSAQPPLYVLWVHKAGGQMALYSNEVFMPEMTYRDALNLALKEEMRRDPP